MKLSLLTFQSQKSDWVGLSAQEFEKKINHLNPFTVDFLKSPKAEREAADFKKRSEAEILLKKISAKSKVILWDERGEIPKSSVEMSQKLMRLISSNDVVMVIGGAYGVHDSVKERADHTWSFSKLTMNHNVALTAILEQTYRAFAIAKNLPYHNE